MGVKRGPLGARVEVVAASTTQGCPNYRRILPLTGLRPTALRKGSAFPAEIRENIVVIRRVKA